MQRLLPLPLPLHWIFMITQDQTLGQLEEQSTYLVCKTNMKDCGAVWQQPTILTSYSSRFTYLHLFTAQDQNGIWIKDFCLPFRHVGSWRTGTPPSGKILHGAHPLITLTLFLHFTIENTVHTFYYANLLFLYIHFFMQQYIHLSNNQQL
jgi:hypothetical protein